MTTYNTGNPIGSTDSRDRLDNTENMDYLENSTTELTHPDRLGTIRKTRHGMEAEHDAQISAHESEHDAQISAHKSEHDAQISAHKSEHDAQISAHESEHDAQISAHESEHDAQMQVFESDFDGRLAGMAFTRVGSFTTGATLADMRQVLAWEVSQGGDGHEYGWSGTFPKVVSAGATPATSGGIGAGAWVDRTDLMLRSDLLSDTGSDLVSYTPTVSAKKRSVTSRLKDTVSVLDYYDENEADATYNAFTRALAAGKTVELPQSITLTGMNSTVYIPDGKDVVLYGGVIGSGSGKFDMQGSGEFYMRGGLLTNVPLALRSGSPRVKGFTYTGRAVTQALLIQGTSTYKNILIDKPNIYGANYGILRQGSNSSIRNMIISGGTFQDLRGDAIELNVCVNDRGVLISNHTIDLIDSTPTGNPNWGIGIGIAGNSSNNNWLDSEHACDFVITDIVGTRLRQLIHVEIGMRFDISNISANDISTAYSTTSGMPSAVVAIYGSSDFTVSSVNGRNLVSSGVNAQSSIANMVPAAPCQNFVIKDITLSGTQSGMTLDLGNTGAYSKVKDVKINGGAFVVSERSSDMEFTNIFVKRNKSLGKAVTIDLDKNTDGRQVFRAESPILLKVDGVNGVDEYGAKSSIFTSCVGDIATVKNVNADVNTVNGYPSIATPTGINREFIINSAGDFPYGLEVCKNDVVIDKSNGTRYLVTAGGSVNRGSDTFSVYDLAKKTIKTTNHAWATGNHHYVGQNITLSGIGSGGASLVTTITQVYVSGGSFYMRIADPISAAVNTTGTITATTTATYISM